MFPFRFGISISRLIYKSHSILCKQNLVYVYLQVNGELQRTGNAAAVTSFHVVSRLSRRTEGRKEEQLTSGVKTQHSLVGGRRRFGGTFGLHLQVRRIL